MQWVSEVILQRRDEVMVERGFTIEDLLLPLGVGVECAIRRVKDYDLVSVA